MDVGRWPLVPEPYDDELFSSFMARTAAAHYTSLEGLFSHFWPHRVYYKKDMDIFDYPDEFWNVLAHATGLSWDRLQQMRLKTYEGYVQEKIDCSGRHHWIAPLGNVAKNEHFRNMRFCPQCLKEAPYYQKEWRLLFINACVRHNCYLHNRCQKCGSNVHLLDLGPMRKLTQCAQCGFDHRDAMVKPVPLGSYGVKAIQRLQNIAERGYYLLDGRWHYAPGLFHVLRIIIARMAHAGFGEILTSDDLGLKGVLPYDLSNIRYIEEMEPECLYIFVSAACSVLEDWPVGFRDYCRKNGWTNMRLVLERLKYETKDMPFWFVNGIDSLII